jgi:hypothetical protein
MSEPVTLESLSKQRDRMLVEMQAMRDAIQDTRKIIHRCIAKASEVQELMEEFLSLSRTLECD